MSSQFDGLILPTLPLNREATPFELDMHKFLQNLLRMLKTIPDAGFPTYYNLVGLGDDETWDNARSGIYLISGASGTILAIANCIVGTSVTILHSDGNWATADTDAKYCLYDNTTGIRLKNRIGSVKQFAVMIITND